MKIPYTGHCDESKFKHRFGTPLGEPCIMCGRRVYPVTRRVHLVDGGSMLASIDEPEDVDAADELGWHAIGPDCAQRLPPGFVGLFEPEEG